LVAPEGVIYSAQGNSFAHMPNYALGLVRIWLAPKAGNGADEDDPNRFRRLESQYPEIGRTLEVLQRMDVESSAKELLRLIKNLGTDHLSEVRQSQIKVAVDRLGWEL